jgi:hypothetical protein
MTACARQATRAAAAVLLALGAAAISAAGEALPGEPPPPADALPGEPLRPLSLSPLGGMGDDEVVAVAIAPDFTVLAAGNTVDLALPGVAETILGPAGTLEAAAAEPRKKDAPHPSTHGFLIRTSSDGRKALAYVHFGYGQATIQHMRLDERGGIYLSGARAAGAGGPAGTYIARLAADARSLSWTLAVDRLQDFAVDRNGDVVALAGTALTRYAAGDGKELWSVNWSSHGDNRPGAMTLSAQTGIAAVVGYGMTRTGHEPYKDPYAYAFDRMGKPAWSAWNPDPTRECDARFGGNGLMADTTGHAAGVTDDGKIMLMLYADGGNTVCMRDPADPGRPLPSEVFAGVHQSGPGFGFHGASKTSVILRFDAASGRIEKGTWMSAWLSPQHANGLSIDAACGDAALGILIAGNSASGCPLKEPWFPAVEGSYKGGGFLALFDADFKLRQCGYFAHSRLTCVAARGGYVVVGGSVQEGEGDDATRDPVKLFKPLQARLGGGRDGYLAVFHRRP